MENEITRSASILARALREAPVQVVPRRTNSNTDRVTVEAPRAKAHLTLLWAGEGWPSDVDNVLTDAPDPLPAEFVVVARHFSPGALRKLREREANWVDETGDARIVGPSGLFVIRQHHHPHVDSPRSQDRTFAWSPSAVTLAEAILAGASEPIVNRVLQELTSFSASQISRTLSQFDKRGWTRKTGGDRGPGAQRALEDGDGLLRSWAAHLGSTPRPVIQAHAILKDPLGFLRRDFGPVLDGLGSWALTGWAGLELEAPFATQVPTLHIYVEDASFENGSVDRALTRSSLRRVDEGGRVVIWPAEPVVFRLKKVSRRGGLPVVSPPRLYADLLALGGRGVDAAEHVREALIEL